MKKRLTRIILALLIGIFIYCAWDYVGLFKKNRELDFDLAKARGKASQLKVQLDSQVISNQRLQKERYVLQSQLVSAQEEMAMFKEDMDRLEQDLDSLKTRVSSFERNNILLRSRIKKLARGKKKLEVKIEELIQAKENLAARFYSLSELRKAINYLKKRPSEQRKPVQVYEENLDSSSAGNQGYLMRRGQSTHRSHINIRVLPAP